MNPLIKAIDANLRVMELQEENKRLRSALEQVEWVYDASHGPNEECAWCRNMEHEGHKPDCARQAALRPEQSHTHYCQEHADRWECRDANCERGEVSGCPEQPADATPTPAMLDAKRAVDEYGKE